MMTKYLRMAVGAVVAVVLAICAAPAGAADGDIDFGAMVPEQTYSYTAFSIVSGSYTPTQSGTVKIQYTTTPLTLYSSAQHKVEQIVEGSHAYTDAGQVMSYNLEIGTTYYLYGMPMDTGSLVIHEGETVLEVTSCIPFPADPFSVSSNYRIEVTFNYPVTVGNAFLMVGDTRQQISTTVSNTTVTCEVASTVMDLYKQGLLNEGDEMVLRIMQVRDASNPEVRYGDLGRLELTFNVCAKPAELVSIENANLNGSVLDSYYFPGDPNALVKFHFDRDLSAETTPNGILQYGDIDNLDVGMYTEVIPGENNGSVATFDFAGRLRRPIDMLPFSTPETQPGSLGVSFGNLFTPDGQRVYTGSMSNPTSYSVSFRLNVLQYNIAADFTPPRGTELRPSQPMEIWVMNGNKIRFDAVCFEATQGGNKVVLEVPADQVTAEVDEFSADDMIFTLTTPHDLWGDGGTDIYVTFKNLICSDGLDHSADIFGDFSAYRASVDELGAETAARSDVYSAAGVLLKRNASRADLKTLPAGLYIVGGKKVIVR